MFLLACPVVWNMTNRAEGVLVAGIPARKIIAAHLSGAGDDDGGFRVRSGERVLFAWFEIAIISTLQEKYSPFFP